MNLNQFSKSSGCGCKIAPEILQKIIAKSAPAYTDANLLVGNEFFDDAAVYNLGNGQALISTVDFFTPIVADAELFGKIAAANALSDVYAMGGTPLMATAILGWPVDKLPAEKASEVLAGASQKCAEAKIAIAGGHSIDSPEPFFGLSVNGICSINHFKKNKGARPQNLLYLTKPLGSGILSAALKRDKLKAEHEKDFYEQLQQLNSIGSVFGKLNYVTALTDVTGFGLLGHLIELLEASDVSAELDYAKIKLLNGTLEYASQMIVPDNLYRNWNHLQHKVSGIGQESFFTLNDPQTNGGLLVAIDKNYQKEFENLLKEHALELFAQPIAHTLEKTTQRVIIKNTK